LAPGEYVAAYKLGQDVPFTTYTWRNGVGCARQAQTVISEGVSWQFAGRNGPMSCAWLRGGATHSRTRMRVAPPLAPNTAAYAARVRAEGGGGDYGGASGGFDQLGFGTLAYTL
jgi:hypothetical protein